MKMMEQGTPVKVLRIKMASLWKTKQKQKPDKQSQGRPRREDSHA